MFFWGESAHQSLHLNMLKKLPLKHYYMGERAFWIPALTYPIRNSACFCTISQAQQHLILLLFLAILLLQSSVYNLSNCWGRAALEFIKRVWADRCCASLLQWKQRSGRRDLHVVWHDRSCWQTVRYLYYRTSVRNAENRDWWATAGAKAIAKDWAREVGELALGLKHTVKRGPTKQRAFCVTELL